MNLRIRKLIKKAKKPHKKAFHLHTVLPQYLSWLDQLEHRDMLGNNELFQLIQALREKLTLEYNAQEQKTHSDIINGVNVASRALLLQLRAEVILLGEILRTLSFAEQRKVTAIHLRMLLERIRRKRQMRMMEDDLFEIEMEIEQQEEDIEFTQQTNSKIVYH